MSIIILAIDQIVYDPNLSKSFCYMTICSFKASDSIKNIQQTIALGSIFNTRPDFGLIEKLLNKNLRFQIKMLLILFLANSFWAFSSHQISYFVSPNYKITVENMKH